MRTKPDANSKSNNQRTTNQPPGGSTTFLASIFLPPLRGTRASCCKYTRRAAAPAWESHHAFRFIVASIPASWTPPAALRALKLRRFGLEQISQHHLAFHGPLALARRLEPGTPRRRERLLGQ